MGKRKGGRPASLSERLADGYFVALFGYGDDIDSGRNPYSAVVGDGTVEDGHAADSADSRIESLRPRDRDEPSAAIDMDGISRRGREAGEGRSRIRGERFSFAVEGCHLVGVVAGRRVVVGEAEVADRRVVDFHAVAIDIVALQGQLYRRAKEREMRENMAAAMLRESQSRLARESVLFEQKEKLIDDLQNRIEAAAESGDLSPNRAGQILTTLKVHASGREERKAFLDIYDHLLPGLARRLKADFPTMTEGQVKLCAYIGAGMSNASIAKLLNITVQSVRTNRYRLRTRFGLAPSDSLEDFIRRYVE